MRRRTWTREDFASTRGNSAGCASRPSLPNRPASARIQLRLISLWGTSEVDVRRDGARRPPEPQRDISCPLRRMAGISSARSAWVRLPPPWGLLVILPAGQAPRCGSEVRLPEEGEAPAGFVRSRVSRRAAGWRAWAIRVSQSRGPRPDASSGILVTGESARCWAESSVGQRVHEIGGNHHRGQKSKFPRYRAKRASAWESRVPADVEMKALVASRPGNAPSAGDQFRPSPINPGKMSQAGVHRNLPRATESPGVGGGKIVPLECSQDRRDQDGHGKEPPTSGMDLSWRLMVAGRGSGHP